MFDYIGLFLYICENQLHDHQRKNYSSVILHIYDNAVLRINLKQIDFMPYIFKTKRDHSLIDLYETKRKASAIGMELRDFVAMFPDEVVERMVPNTDVYISILSPHKDDYMIMYHRMESESIWYTEKDYYRVCHILDTKKIKYEIVEK